MIAATDVRAVWTFVHAEGLSFKNTLQPGDPSSLAPAERADLPLDPL